MTAAAAATVILDGVKAGRWRILVGDDAHRLDERVRQNAGARLRRRVSTRALRRRPVGDWVSSELEVCRLRNRANRPALLVQECGRHAAPPPFAQFQI